MIEDSAMFQFLGIVVVASPLLLTLALGFSSIMGWKLSEDRTANLIYLAIMSGLIASIIVLVSMLISGDRHVAIRIGDWVGIPHYHFSIKFVFDRLSVPLAILSFVLAGTIGAFASKYARKLCSF